jgi:Mn-dependent DtxR family transcriptional regulator
MPQDPDATNGSARPPKRPASAAPVKANEAFSFLKETQTPGSWTPVDLEKCLRVSSAEAHQIISMLELQGYVKMRGREWVTTSEGYTVSGALMPRYSHATIERAFARLKDQIEEVNRNARSAYRVVGAVAFGDFLNKEATRVQAADVGVRLDTRSVKEANESGVAQKSEDLFLKHLRNGMAMIHVHKFEDWMSKRSHLRLI